MKSLSWTVRNIDSITRFILAGAVELLRYFTSEAECQQ